MQQRCSTHASHWRDGNLPSSHVRRDWLDEGVRAANPNPLNVGKREREEANFCCALCMRDETGRVLMIGLEGRRR